MSDPPVGSESNLAGLSWRDELDPISGGRRAESVVLIGRTRHSSRHMTVVPGHGCRALGWLIRCHPWSLSSGHGQPRARRAAGRARHPRRCRRAARAPTTTSARSVRPRPAGRVRDVRAPRFGVPCRVQRGAHPRRRPRRSAAIGASRATPGRCSSAGTPTRSRSPRGGRRSRCWSRTASRSGWTRPTASRPPRPCRTRSSSPTATAGRAASGSRTASWSRRRTTRPTTAASSTTRPTAVRPTPT